MKTKIFLGGKDAPAEKTSGKVPKVSDMEEGSPEEEDSESPDEEAKEQEAGEGDSDNTTGETKGGGVNKDALKQAMKEIDMEKSLGYSLEGRSKEELQKLIEMAQDAIANGKYKDSASNSANPISKY